MKTKIYNPQYQYLCTDCGTNTGVLRVKVHDADQIYDYDLCQDCLDEREKELEEAEK